jgi:stearoyl-CoA desaturase (delta-9 desaturase)
MVYAFFAAHWVLAVLFQSLFQHRYAAHRMYAMGPRTEKAMNLLAYLVQGPSYLVPRAYAILHREHHAYSDTEKDPHSPHNYRGFVSMMMDTKHRYDGYAYKRAQPEPRFLGGYPEWDALDRLSQSRLMRAAWIVAYTAFYLAFATSAWQFLLLPVHFLMGPVHGAIVNWAGHKYGYANFDNGDKSRNTLPMDVLCMGELFQNNHHKFGMSPNFAARRWEVDPTWWVMRGLHAVGLVRITSPQRAVYPEPYAGSRPSVEAA